MAHFTRSPAPSNVTGGYAGYRLHLRRDFVQSCAYCLISEFWAAGEENFEIDHFRPAFKFKHLVTTYTNLYYSCHVCNHIKRDKWPDDALLAKGIGFVDLCEDDFDTHFAIGADGKLVALTPSAEYTIGSLRLNRRHLIQLRKFLAEARERGIDLTLPDEPTVWSLTDLLNGTE